MGAFAAYWHQLGRYRWAELNGLTLIVTNGRTGILGPVRWWVQRDMVTLAAGKVFRGKRYIALTQEAMRSAEAAALAIR